jgi:hypothetical protein
MRPESESSVISGKKPTAPMRRRGEARARPARVAATTGEQPIARIRELVAAMKAAQEGAATPAAPDPRERVKLMGWLRRILEKRAQERRGWEEQVKTLEARFQLAETAARTALAAAAEADTQHHRLVTDLKLMHEHQRSIWELERRRLEITIDGLQRERRNRFIARAARLARPAVIAGLLLTTAAALALSADSLHAAGRMLLDRNDAPAGFFVLN